MSSLLLTAEITAHLVFLLPTIQPNLRNTHSLDFHQLSPILCCLNLFSFLVTFI